MIRSTIVLGLAACGFFACSESSPRAEPEEALGPIEVMSPLLSLGGVAAQQEGYAPMVTLDGPTYPSWIVMTTAGEAPVTLTRLGGVSTLLPAAVGGSHRLVFVRVRADGTVGGIIDAPTAQKSIGLFMQACGSSVWANAMSEDGLTQWLVRMDQRLDEIELATFVINPTAAGFKEIWIDDLSCSDGRLHFTMRHSGVLSITPPDGDVVTLSTDQYDTRVVDADRLFDDGVVPPNAAGQRNLIMAMSPGVDGGLLVHVVRSDVGGMMIARFDTPSDAFEELGTLALHGLVTAMTETTKGERALCMARPIADALQFGGVAFADADADGICLLTVGGAASPIELRAFVERAFFDDAGTLWLAGQQNSSDPLLGSGPGVVANAQPPYLVGLDPDTREVTARAGWHQEGRTAEVDDAFLARSTCDGAPTNSAALRLTSYEPVGGAAFDFRLVLAGEDSTACSARIATWYPPTRNANGHLSLSTTPSADCAHTRYLAAVPDTGRLTLQTEGGERTAVGTGQGLDLVVFSPSECLIERR